jgi:L-rhamnose isomerase/sugar isomerase
LIDQSHNLKPKIEATIQTVCVTQELYAKAALVDYAQLAQLQQDCSLIDAEETLHAAFWRDVRPIVCEWRKSHGLPENPLVAFRESGYLQQATRDRRKRNAEIAASYA